MPNLKFECPKCLIIQDIDLSCSNCGENDPVGINHLLNRQNEREVWREKESALELLIPLVFGGFMLSLFIFVVITIVAGVFFKGSALTTDSGQLLLLYIGVPTITVIVFLLVKMRRDRRETAMDDLYEDLAASASAWVRDRPKQTALQGVPYQSFASAVMSEKAISHSVRPNDILGQCSDGEEAFSRFARYALSPDLRCLVKKGDGSCDIPFKDAVARIAALNPKLDAPTIQHAAYTSCVLTEADRQNMVDSLINMLQLSHQNWRKSLRGERYLKRAQKPFF